jgi:hypothetical protein
MTVVTYAQPYRPKKKLPAPTIEGSAIVTAKKSGPRQRAKAEPDLKLRRQGVAQAGDAGARPGRRLMVSYECRNCGYEQHLEAAVTPPKHGRCLRCALLRFLVPDWWERLTTSNRIDREWPRE